MSTSDAYALKFQGTFALFRGREPLWNIFPDPIRARQRVEWVEIETSLDEVDVARVAFRDPELAVASAVAEEWREGAQARYTPWTVKIGYYFTDGPWATFTGIPKIESSEFPENGAPRTVVRLFSPSVALKECNSAILSGKEVPSRHWMHEPHSIRKALEQMASFWGRGLKLGSKLSEIINEVDQAFQAYDQSPVDSFDQKNVPEGVAQEVWEYLLGHPKFLRPPENADDQSDWDYLRNLVNFLQPLVNAKYLGESTAGAQDVVPSLPSKTKLKIVFGFSGGDLYFCCLEDYLGDMLNVVPIFEYQEGRRTLLSFRPTIKQTQTNVGIIAMIAALLHRNTKTKNIYIDSTGFSYEGSPTGPWPPTDVSPSDPEKQPPTQSTSTTPKMLAFWEKIYNHLWAKADVTAVLGALATNISGEATVLGMPFLRAGMVVGLAGLSPGPENEPEPNTPQRITPYSRLYLAKRCTHRVDQKGLYITRIQVGGATTDNSAEQIAKALSSGGVSDKQLQQLFNNLVSGTTQGLEGGTGGKPWYFSAWDFLKQFGGMLGF